MKTSAAASTDPLHNPPQTTPTHTQTPHNTKQGICFIKRWRDGARARYNTMVAHAEMADALQRDPNFAPPPQPQV